MPLLFLGGSVDSLTGGSISSLFESTVGKFIPGGDKTLNFGPTEQTALDSEKGQAIYAAYIDYGMTVHEAAILTVADLVTGDKMADQKAARKKVLQSPLLIAQQKYPTDPSKWPDGVLTMNVDGKRVRRINPAIGDPSPILPGPRLPGEQPRPDESKGTMIVMGIVGLVVLVGLVVAFKK